jgi:hypothetical protein
VLAFLVLSLREAYNSVQHPLLGSHHMKRLALLTVVIGLALSTRPAHAADSQTGVELLAECQAATQVGSDHSSLSEEAMHCLG